eukprot:TRINITY_DN882_c1_g1_i1.p1 TRINITY_DN882_c1_g1~~TRINITY_DN882_c1_g1_i1.p1  ORF type:complete len:161 (+),score=68.84 TRINITY_DN882_c1_g1_i1:188-670(+)
MATQPFGKIRYQYLGDKVVICATVPKGLDPESLFVDIKDGMLNIRGRDGAASALQQQQAAQQARLVARLPRHQQQRYQQQLQRQQAQQQAQQQQAQMQQDRVQSLRLPSGLDSRNIKTEIVDGQLQIELTKTTTATTTIESVTNPQQQQATTTTSLLQVV